MIISKVISAVPSLGAIKSMCSEHTHTHTPKFNAQTHNKWRDKYKQIENLHRERKNSIRTSSQEKWFKSIEIWAKTQPYRILHSFISLPHLSHHISHSSSATRNFTRQMSENMRISNWRNEENWEEIAIKQHAAPTDTIVSLLLNNVPEEVLVCVNSERATHMCMCIVFFFSFQFHSLHFTIQHNLVSFETLRRVDAAPSLLNTKLRTLNEFYIAYSERIYFHFFIRSREFDEIGVQIEFFKKKSIHKKISYVDKNWQNNIVLHFLFELNLIEKFDFFLTKNKYSD